MCLYNPYSRSYLAHYGVKGMKWGVRRYRDKNGNFTQEVSSLPKMILIELPITCMEKNIIVNEKIIRPLLILHFHLREEDRCRNLHRKSAES